MNQSRNLINPFPNLFPLERAGQLLCPDCQSLMTPFACQDATIDKCNQCHGIWFDQKKFGVFKRTLDTFDLSNIREVYQPSHAEPLCISSCPRCALLLDEVPYSYKSGVKFKKCGKCLGLWLNFHQTLNLIELTRLGQEIAPDITGVLTGLKELATEKKAVEKMKFWSERSRRVWPSLYLLKRILSRFFY